LSSSPNVAVPKERPEVLIVTLFPNVTLEVAPKHPYAAVLHGPGTGVGAGVGAGVTGVGTGVGAGVTGVGTGVGAGVAGVGTGVGTGVGAGVAGVGTGVGAGVTGVGTGVGAGVTGPAGQQEIEESSATEIEFATTDPQILAR